MKTQFVILHFTFRLLSSPSVFKDNGIIYKTIYLYKIWGNSQGRIV